MAVTDYIYQQETVLKKDLEFWLIAKMQAAGWQQIGSNPPTSVADGTTGRFFVMKGKRASDNMDTYVAINGYATRQRHNNTYSGQMNIIPLLDYTPGAAGTSGTTSKGTYPLSAAATTPANNNFQWTLFGTYNTTIYPADTPLNVRFCITAHNVSLAIRTPNFYSEAGGYLFFGLPDILGKEKNSGITTVTGSTNGATSNANFHVADTPLNIPSPVPPNAASSYETIQARSIAPGKSPDVNGLFMLLYVYGVDTNSGMRLRHPSSFFLPDGGLLDGDLIQYQGMTLEVMRPQTPMSGGFQAGYVVYRIA